MRLLWEMLIYFLQDCFNITDYPKIDHDILIHLCRININLKNLRIFCKCCSISGYTVTESCSCYDQKIAFTYAKVRCLCSMHSEHSGISLICSRKSSFSHQGICYRCIYFLCKFIKFFTCLRKNSSTTYKNKWSFCCFDHIDSFLEILFL